MPRSTSSPAATRTPRSTPKSAPPRLPTSEGRSRPPAPRPNPRGLKPLRYRNHTLYRTPAGEVVGREHAGPKTKIADSKKEYRRLLELLELRDAGAIEFLRTQVRFRLHGPGGTRLCTYVADFVYVVKGRRIVEDVKSKITKMDRMYRLKKKWLLDEWKIEVLET